MSAAEKLVEEDRDKLTEEQFADYHAV